MNVYKSKFFLTAKDRRGYAKKRKGVPMSGLSLRSFALSSRSLRFPSYSLFNLSAAASSVDSFLEKQNLSTPLFCPLR